MEHQRRREHGGSLQGLHQYGWAEPDDADGHSAGTSLDQSVQFLDTGRELQALRAGGRQTILGKSDARTRELHAGMQQPVGRGIGDLVLHGYSRGAKHSSWEIRNDHHLGEAAVRILRQQYLSLVRFSSLQSRLRLLARIHYSRLRDGCLRPHDYYRFRCWEESAPERRRARLCLLVLVVRSGWLRVPR